MNYTGRPSISGCRPVLSLYPTHHFCQYLLRIFITFTNSSLFCRAFSTNSRRLLRHAAGVDRGKLPGLPMAPPLGELAGASPTERARPLTANPRHSDSIALTKSLPIAAQRLFPAGLALSVTFGDTARVAAPSVCFAAARILLAAAPTAPPCFRHWRRSSPLLPKGEALAGRIVSCIFLAKRVV